jgi:1-acyl-sn-glycerol-3-phosphate acyltransferase
MKQIRATLFVIAVIVFSVPLTSLIILFWHAPWSWRIGLAMTWRRCFMASVRGILGIRMDLRGRENIPPGPCIILSKHQSAWETVAVQEVFHPRWLVFVLKRELIKLPFIGWALAAMRMISIDRSAGASALEQIVEQGRDRLEAGFSIVVFPEGTRVAPGTSRRYKGGGAHLAVATGYPVVPVAHNAGELWPRNAFVKTPGTVTLSVGPAIDPKGKSVDELTREVEAWIEAQMRVISPRYHGTQAPRNAAAD